MRSRSSELNPQSEHWQFCRCRLPAGHNAWGNLFQHKLLAQVNRWRADLDDGPHSFHSPAWWTSRYVFEQAFCWARSKMNPACPHPSFFKNKRAIFLFRLCDPNRIQSTSSDEVSVIHQRLQECQLKSSMFMDKSPRRIPSGGSFSANSAEVHCRK